VVLYGVARDPIQGDGVVKDQMGKETPVLITPGGIVREIEPVPLEVLPEEFGRERMVLSAVLRASVDAFQGPSDRIARFAVAQLHGVPRDVPGYLAKGPGEWVLPAGSASRRAGYLF